MTNQTFGGFLRDVVRAVGIPPAALALRCGITDRMLRFYMSDTHRPGPQILQKLCEVLGLSPTDTAARFKRKRPGRPRYR